jgi:hypothetical protein
MVLYDHPRICYVNTIPEATSQAVADRYLCQWVEGVLQPWLSKAHKVCAATGVLAGFVRGLSSHIIGGVLLVMVGPPGTVSRVVETPDGVTAALCRRLIANR